MAESIAESMPDTPPTILVADDEPDLVYLVSRRLVKSGFTVITAVDGEDALRQIRQQLPDLALLDVMMPKLSGLEVSRILRAAPETHHIPVILMSAALIDRLIVPHEADAFIAKPFGPLELPALVRSVLAQTPRAALDCLPSQPHDVT